MSRPRTTWRSTAISWRTSPASSTASRSACWARRSSRAMTGTEPSFALPPDACDCHTHVFGPAARYPFAAKRAYTPPDASVASLLELQRTLHLGRVVIVQPSVYGTDNRCTLDGMRRLGGVGP